jgi:hypothetical protein
VHSGPVYLNVINLIAFLLNEDTVRHYQSHDAHTTTEHLGHQKSLRLYIQSPYVSIGAVTLVVLLPKNIVGIYFMGRMLVVLMDTWRD